VFMASLFYRNAPHGASPASHGQRLPRPRGLSTARPSTSACRLLIKGSLLNAKAPY